MITGLGSPMAASMTMNATRDENLEKAAKGLEQTFVFEMLKHSGIGETPESFGGGVGEDQFASLLQGAYAEKIVEAGGLGLAAHIEAALKARNAQ